MITPHIATLVAEGPLSAVITRHLFTMQAEVRAVTTVGATPGGFRRIALISGGQVTGERLSGRVLDGATDWQVRRPDGSLALDIRLAIETERGALVTMIAGGIRHGPADVIGRLDRGETVDPASYYFRIAPTFETADAELGWLNGIQAIGIGHRVEAGPLFNVFEVL